MYMATINTPGYLPEDDDPPVFDTASEAWTWLADERQTWEIDMEPDEHYSMDDPDRFELSEVVADLREQAAVTAEEIPTVMECLWGHSVGRRGDPHDLGQSYCVTPV